MKIELSADFEKAYKHLKKKYPSLKEDLRLFAQELLLNPNQGVEIFSNCRKARMAITSKGKGKSAGARIIFYFKLEKDSIVLLYIYDKSEMENISDTFLSDIIRSL